MTAFLAAREREGARLASDVLAKLEGIRGMVATIAARSAENVASYRTMLKLGMRLCKDDGVRTNRSMGAEKRVELTCEILL